MPRRTPADDELLQRARKEAVRVLRSCSHARGMKASARGDGYPQVWARDSMITLLGGVLADDAKVRRALKASLETLMRHQTPRGLVPNNVHSKSGLPNWRAYADGGAWYVIGLAAYVERTDDDALLRKHWPAVERTLEWYAYQDVDASGLVTMSEAADWEDLFAVRGKGLTVNALRAIATRRAGDMAARLGFDDTAKARRREAKALARIVNDRFWYEPSRNTPEGAFRILNGEFRNAAAKARFRKRLPKLVMPKKRVLAGSSHYLPYITFNDFGEWFDSLGNLLMVLGGIAPSNRAATVLDLMHGKRVARPYPAKAITPPIRRGQHDWREYYRNLDLNLPDQYHNGGIWPFIGGFHVAALVAEGRADEARKALVALAEANRVGKEGEWEFNEWLHGKTGKPKGMVAQAWSAGMYLYADECVRTGKIRFFS